MENQSGHQLQMRNLRHIGYFLFDIALALVAYLAVHLAASFYCGASTFYVSVELPCTCCLVNAPAYEFITQYIWILAVWFAPFILLGTLIGRLLFGPRGRTALRALNVGLIALALGVLLVRTIWIVIA